MHRVAAKQAADSLKEIKGDRHPGQAQSRQQSHPQKHNNFDVVAAGRLSPRKRNG